MNTTRLFCFCTTVLFILSLHSIALGYTQQTISLANGETITVQKTNKICDDRCNGVFYKESYKFSNGTIIEKEIGHFGLYHYSFSDGIFVKVTENAFGDLVYSFPAKDHAMRLKLISQILSLSNDKKAPKVAKLISTEDQ